MCLHTYLAGLYVGSTELELRGGKKQEKDTVTTYLGDALVYSVELQHVCMWQNEISSRSPAVI